MVIVEILGVVDGRSCSIVYRLLLVVGVLATKFSRILLVVGMVIGYHGGKVTFSGVDRVVHVVIVLIEI